MNCDAAHFAVQQLALARVQPCAHLEAEVAHPFGDRAGAAYGPGRSVEAGEEPVARRVELASAEAHELTPDQGVVFLEQLAPAAIAEVCRPRRRADDVGEENSCEGAVGLALLPAAGLPDLGDETLDLFSDHVPHAPATEREVADSRQFHETCCRDA